MERAANDRRFGAAVLVASSVFLIATHASLIGYKHFANVDESYAIALAQRLLDGHALYHGAISQRGPLMYYAYALIAKTGGWDNIVNLRLWALAFAFLHVGLVYWGALRLISQRAAIVATLISTYALTLGLPPFDRFALNGEYLQLPPLVLGIVLGALALRRNRPRRRGLLFAAGLALGAAISVKQSAALHVVPALLWIGVRAHRERTLRTALVDTAALLGGALVIPVIFVIHAASNGTLAEMYFYCVRYNVNVHVGEASWGLTPASFEVQGNRGFALAIGAVSIAGIRALGLRIRACIRERSIRPLLRAFELGQYLAVHLAVALLSAASLRRFFSHYFILSIPILAFILARLVDRSTRSVKPETMRTIYRGTLATLLALCTLETYALEKIDGRVAHDKLVVRLSQYIDATTAKDDKIFVWGFSPWLYAYSHRRPAGRYVFSTYVTGLVPWRHDDLAGEQKRIVPGSNEALMDDLERENPELFIDAGSIMLARPVRTYPRWAAWLRERYCFEVRVRGFDVYRRKKDGGACTAPGFPQPQRAFDFVGAPLEVPIPQTSDLDFTKSLYVPEDSLPAWYPQSPRPPHVDLLVDPSEMKPHMRLENMR
jgi:4-amino-4-deoxy-L-arabinose transferase-like glycosyltransferase